MSLRAKRIASNTAFLYVRMLITMAISLYTSRVLLDTLGASDFGLYHVIAGFVVLAGFLKGALSGATQRFIAFELGKKQSNQLRDIFSMSINTHILFAFIIVSVGGLLGTWLIPEILTFDNSRTDAVLLVFWFALISFAVNIAVVPFHAMIISHEKMKIFAWVSISDAVLKLSIVFLIQHIAFDPLVSYSVLVMFVTSTIALIYVVYVTVTYSEHRWYFSWDKMLFHKLVSFSGWTVWGNAASVFSQQGTDVLLNVFFGPVVNAAKSVSSQASNALNQFVTNLQLAINPQIIKSYSGNDSRYTTKLLNYGSKYNFFLIFTLALPILIRTEDFLSVWLIEPPKYSAIFLRLILVNVILESISRPLITAAQATGKIKLYQLVVGGILLLNLPLSYFILSLDFQPQSVFWIAIFVTSIAAVTRIFMLKRIFYFSFVNFFKITLLRISLVSSTSFFIVGFLNKTLPNELGFLKLIGFTLLSFVAVAIIIWCIGLEKHESFRLKKLMESHFFLKGK